MNSHDKRILMYLRCVEMARYEPYVVSSLDILVYMLAVVAKYTKSLHDRQHPVVVYTQNIYYKPTSSNIRFVHY